MGSTRTRLHTHQGVVGQAGKWGTTGGCGGESNEVSPGNWEVPEVAGGLVLVCSSGQGAQALTVCFLGVQSSQKWPLQTYLHVSLFKGK